MVRRELGRHGKRKYDIVVRCLAIYFVMMPFDSFPVFGLGSLLKLVALLPAASILMIHRRTKLVVNKLTFPFLIYVLANALTCMYSVDAPSSLAELKRLLLNGALILAVGGMYTEYSREDSLYLTKALVAGGLFTALMTLAFSGFSSDGRITMAVNGAMQDPNEINGYMYFAFAFFANKLIGEKKLPYAAPALLLIVFTLMTGSRGAALGLAVLGITVFLCHLFRSGRIRPGVLLAALAVVIAFAVSCEYILSLLPKTVAIRFSLEYIRSYKGTSRTRLWAEILKIYGGGNCFRKIFGYGYGTVPYVNTYNRLAAHNIWLEHLISGGIVGLGVLIYMQIVFALEAWRQKGAVLFSSYIGYLAMCMTLSLTNYKPLWNCMMMVMILYFARRNDSGIPEAWN